MMVLQFVVVLYFYPETKQITLERLRGGLFYLNCRQINFEFFGQKVCERALE